MPSPSCLYVQVSPIDFGMRQPNFKKLGMYIMAPVPI
jgi:hypothetical protein